MECLEFLGAPSKLKVALPIIYDPLNVHKNQQAQHRHLEFVPEFKFRIQFLFILRHVHKCTCNFVLFHLFCMTVYTGKLCIGTLKLRSR